MTEYALRLENGADTAERMRKGDALVLTPGAVSGARNGLRSDGGGVVTAVDGTMTVQVTPFRAWVDGGASDAQGGYPFVLDATKTLTITDGDAVLPRTDTIVAEVLDNTYDASGSTLAQVRVVTGTPGAGAPVLPASCVALRDVSVPAGLSAGTGGLSSSNVGADRRVYTAALGGIVPVASATERDGMDAQLGQPVYRLDTGNVQVFNGTDWDTFKRDDGLLVQRGVSATSPAVAGNSSDFVADVDFAEAFAGTPTVVGTSVNQWFVVSLNSVSSSMVSFKVRNVGSGSPQTTEVHWIAIGPA